jgi:hypothetical protein
VQTETLGYMPILTLTLLLNEPPHDLKQFIALVVIN